jgi:hypothetical protein
VLDPQPPSVRDRPPEHAAQDVPAAAVGRQDAVGDQERGRPAVFRDHLQRHIVARVGAVAAPGQRFHDLEDRQEQVGLEHVVDALQHHRDAFER